MYPREGVLRYISDRQFFFLGGGGGEILRQNFWVERFWRGLFFRILKVYPSVLEFISNNCINFITTMSLLKVCNRCMMNE